MQWLLKKSHFIRFLLMQGFDEIFLANPIRPSLLEQFYLSVGAGIWEELIFRLILITFLADLIGLVFTYKKSFSTILALLFSGIIFSLFHYVGIYGDIFSWYTFILRTFAGIFLGVVFLSRGLGITVYTHVYYDMLLISIPVLKSTS